MVILTIPVIIASVTLLLGGLGEIADAPKRGSSVHGLKLVITAFALCVVCGFFA